MTEGTSGRDRSEESLSRPLPEPASGEKLSPDQRRELEGFLPAFEDGTLALTPAMRVHAEAAAGVARATLRVAEPGAAKQDRHDLDALLAAAPKLPPWASGWAEPSETQDHLVPRTPNERRHQRASQAGEAVARGWIGHPAVRQEVDAAKAHLNQIAEPLLMFDQKTVTYVTARLLAATAMWPDGREWPDPFAGAPTWLREAAEHAQPAFLEALRSLAHRIAYAGARLDPEDLGGWLVLGQLALLEVDLHADPAELVPKLNTWPPGWIDREAATLGHVATHTSRHGRNARFQADLAATGESVVGRLGPPAIGGRYAGGQRRSKPKREHAVEERRKALTAVLEAFPDVSAGSLCRTWGTGPSTPGGLLRTKLALQPHDRSPSETTLRKDLREIG